MPIGANIMPIGANIFKYFREPNPILNLVTENNHIYFPYLTYKLYVKYEQ